MPRQKKYAEPEPPVVEEVTLDEELTSVIDQLIALRDAVDAEADRHPDRVKLNLANIASAIHSLQDALWTEKALERSDA